MIARVVVIMLACWLSTVAPQGIFQLLTNQGLTEFHRLINSSFAMQSILTNPNLPLTLFVPTDDAISRWRSANRNAPISSDVLQNHIAPGAWNEGRLMEIAQAPLKQDRRIASGYNNGPLWLRYLPPSPQREQAKMFVNGALITSAQPYQIGQLLVFTVDDVIAPTGSAVSATRFIDDPAAQSFSGLALEELRDELRQLTQVNSFQDNSNVYTFLLPNNAAFGAMHNRGAFDSVTVRGHVIAGEALFLRTFNETLADLLSSRADLLGFPALVNADSGGLECYLGYSNASGEPQVYSQTVKGTQKFAQGRVYANVIQANIPVSNGVLHVIDRVLLLIEQNAKELLDTRRSLFRFRDLLNFADPRILEFIRSQNDLTIFVPSNKAIASIPRDKAEMLRRDKGFLERILNMHIVQSKLASDSITNDTTATAVDGSVLTFQVTGTGVYKVLTVNGGSVRARVIESDVGATNAVIHVIDNVLGIPYMNLRDKIESEEDLVRTSRAIDQAGDLRTRLTNLGTNFTFFAPSNQAWQNLATVDREFLMSRTRLLETIMKRHIVSGNKIYSDSLRNNEKLFSLFGELRVLRNNSDLSVQSGTRNVARIIKTDIEAVNGVIHIVDRVLFDRDQDIKYINSSSRRCGGGLNVVVGWSALLLLVFRHVFRW